MDWKIVRECNDENESPTEWSCELAKGIFVWIDKISDTRFGVTTKAGGYDYLALCKSLVSAKRWVTKHANELCK